MRETLWRLWFRVGRWLADFEGEMYVDTFTLTTPNPVVLIEAMKRLLAAKYVVVDVHRRPGPPVIFAADFASPEEGGMSAEEVKSLTEQLEARVSRLQKIAQPPA